MPPQQPSSGKGQGKGPGKSRRRKYSESDDGKEQIPFEVHESAANTYFSNRDYNKAIDNYTKALEIRPGDISCLIARSKCYMELGDLEKALSDSNDVLKDEPNHVKGILQKAEVLYAMGDFETALVFFHRGKKIRAEIREFTLGIQKSSSAIENAVGPESGVHLKNSGDLTYFYEAQEQKQVKKKGYSKPGGRREDKKKDRPQSSKYDTKTIKELLGELYADREYLDKLLKDIEDNGANTKTNDEIKELALEGLRYLDSRTEFWQQQKPMYSRKRDKEMREGTRSRAASPGDRTHWILNKLEEIETMQEEGEYEKSLKTAKKVLKNVEQWSDDDVQNKAELISSLHSFIGNAYMEMGEYNKALQEHNRDLEIAEKEDMQEARSRALDNLGRVYARMGRFEDAIEVWEDKLPLAKVPLEKTWLYHEMGRCYLELGEYEKAQDFGEKSLAAAEEASDDLWQLNATVLVAQAQVKSKDYQASLDSFEKALDMARLQEDRQAEEAIKKALDDVNKKIVKGIKGDDDDSTGRRSPSPSGSEKSTKKSPRDDDKDNKEMTDDKKCKWTIRVYTSDMKAAGTDANVYLFIYGTTKDGSSTQSEKITLDNKDNNFESGKKDEFKVETLNFEKVERIRIGHDNSGVLSGWHLDKVELENASSKKVFTFPCNRWLADDEEDHAIERELTEGAKAKSNNRAAWTVKVYTTDKSGSGTDANVYLTLFGKFDGKDNVQSDKINLDNKGNNFEAGKCDEFEIETHDYDKVSKIVIGHDNSGSFAGWHLHKVELQHKKSKKTYSFPCDRWLADDEDDKKIERELMLGEEKKQSKSTGDTGTSKQNKSQTNDKGHPQRARAKNLGRDHSPEGKAKREDRDHTQKDKAKGHEKDHSPKGKAKGHEKDHSPKGKAKGHDRDHSPKGKAKGHDKDHTPRGKAKGHDRDHSPKGQNKGHDKSPRDKAKHHDKGKK